MNLKKLKINPKTINNKIRLKGENKIHKILDNKKVISNYSGNKIAFILFVTKYFLRNLNFSNEIRNKKISFFI